MENPNDNPVWVEGVLFKEFETKFGSGFSLTFKMEFLDFLMSRIHSSANGVKTVWFKKKNPTDHTTHYGKLSNDKTYESGVENTYSQDSEDNTSKIDPEMDIDNVPF